MNDRVKSLGDATRDESFVGRWSRRKRAEPEKREVEDARVAEQVEEQRAADLAARAPAPSAPVAVPPDLPAIETLTADSDYSRFMKPDVPLASRNAAMKKLFSDPHFNVMDGLDIYIDDYTKEDPIPVEMLRGLAQSRMLKLFNYDKEDAEDAAELARLRAEREQSESVVADNALVGAGEESTAAGANVAASEDSSEDSMASVMAASPVPVSIETNATEANITTTIEKTGNA